MSGKENGGVGTSTEKGSDSDIFSASKAKSRDHLNKDSQYDQLGPSQKSKGTKLNLQKITHESGDLKVTSHHLSESNDLDKLKSDYSQINANRQTRWNESTEQSHSKGDGSLRSPRKQIDDKKQPFGNSSENNLPELNIRRKTE